jgi:hypothetical protein
VSERRRKSRNCWPSLASPTDRRIVMPKTKKSRRAVEDTLHGLRMVSSRRSGLPFTPSKSPSRPNTTPRRCSRSARSSASARQSLPRCSVYPRSSCSPGSAACGSHLHWPDGCWIRSVTILGDGSAVCGNRGQGLHAGLVDAARKLSTAVSLQCCLKHLGDRIAHVALEDQNLR